LGRQLPAGTGRDSSIIGEENSVVSKHKRARKRGPYNKNKKKQKSEEHFISKVLKGPVKREEGMKALELLLQYGTAEQQEKARTKLMMVSGIGISAHSTSYSSSESDDSNDEYECETPESDA
jgi:hypothetical protein